MDFVKVKHFCAPKDTIKRVKRQLTGQEKTFAVASDQGHESRTIENSQDSIKRQLDRKMGKGLEQTVSSPEETEKCLTSP